MHEKGIMRKLLMTFKPCGLVQRIAAGEPRFWALLLMNALLACMAAGCATSAPKPQEIASLLAGTYGTRLPAETGPSRVMHLRLSADYKAELKTVSFKGKAAVTEKGQWEVQPDGSVIVMLTETGGRQYEKPMIVVFVLNRRGLEPINYDRSAWGSGEIVFERQPDIIGIVWHLQEIRYIEDTIVRPYDPSKYSFTLAEDGTVTVQADCNQGKGTYILAGTSISFRNMAFTRAACPPGSHAHQYVRALATAATCGVESGYLLISMEMNSGVMRFAPAQVVK
jgi:heat shock protein HslJ